MLRQALPIPTLWMASEKFRASEGAMCSNLVNMGKATAPPPWLVPPPIIEPNAMVNATFQSVRKWWTAFVPPKMSHAAQMKSAISRLNRRARSAVRDLTLDNNADGNVREDIGTPDL